MRVVISLLNYRPGRVGGAETYLKGLLKHLPEVQQPGDRILAVGYPENAAELQVPGITAAVLPWKDRRLVAARAMEAFTPWRARTAERLINELRPDVVFFPQQSMFPKHIVCPSVVEVFDVQHLVLPRNFSLAERAFRRAIYPWSLRQARRLIAVSEFTRRTLIDYCRVPPEKVLTVHTGCPDFPAAPPEAEPIADPPLIYYPAMLYPHKGHRTLLESFAALARRPGFPYHLVLSGQQTPYWKALQRLIDQLGLGERVRYLGYLPYHEVWSLYRRAAAVVFPSEYEGFGIPVLEAVHYRKKIICSRLPVFDEIGVPQAFQIDFSDPAQFAGALERPGPTVLEKTPATWTDCAARTLAVLRDAAAL